MASASSSGKSPCYRDVEIPEKNVRTSEFYRPTPTEADGSFLLNNGLTVSVVAGDITRVEADGVVVGEDKGFSGSGAVARLLIDAGGEVYQQLRNQVKDMIAKGGVHFNVYRSQGGPNLKFKYVFHAIIDHGMKTNPSVWKNHLETLFGEVSLFADCGKMTSLASALLGTGKAGGSMEASLEAAVRGLSKLTPNVLGKVIIVEYDEKKAKEMKQKLKEIAVCISEGSVSTPERGGRIGGNRPFQSPNTTAPGRGKPTSLGWGSAAGQGSLERVPHNWKAKNSGLASSAAYQYGDTRDRSGSIPHSPRPAAVDPTAKFSTLPKREEIYHKGSDNKASLIRSSSSDTDNSTRQRTVAYDPLSAIPTGDRFFDETWDSNKETGGDDAVWVQRTAGDARQRGDRENIHARRNRPWEDGTEPEQRAEIHDSKGNFQCDEGEDNRRFPNEKEWAPRKAFGSREGSDGGENDSVVLRRNRQPENSIHRYENASERREVDADQSSKHQAAASRKTTVNIVYTHSVEEDTESTKDQDSPNPDPDVMTENMQKPTGVLGSNISRKDEDETPVHFPPNLSKPTDSRGIITWTSSTLPSSQADALPTSPDNREKDHRELTATEHPAKASGQMSEPAEEETASTDETMPPMCKTNYTDPDLNLNGPATCRSPQKQEAAWSRCEHQTEDADHGINHPRREKISSRLERSFQNMSGRSEVALQTGPRSVGGGSNPEGKMVVSEKPSLHLEGFPDCGTILIEYSFPNGTQGPQHPAPGQPYKGTFRRAFLPDNQEGQRVLQLLHTAFDRKLTFQLQQTGPDQEWGVEFADIPHKTSLRGGPDGNLTSVLEKLQRLGLH